MRHFARRVRSTGSGCLPACGPRRAVAAHRDAIAGIGRAMAKVSGAALENPEAAVQADVAPRAGGTTISRGRGARSETGPRISSKPSSIRLFRTCWREGVALGLNRAGRDRRLGRFPREIAAQCIGASISPAFTSEFVDHFNVFDADAVRAQAHAFQAHASGDGGRATAFGKPGGSGQTRSSRSASSSPTAWGRPRISRRSRDGLRPARNVSILRSSMAGSRRPRPEPAPVLAISRSSIRSWLMGRAEGLPMVAIGSKARRAHRSCCPAGQSNPLVARPHRQADHLVSRLAACRGSSARRRGRGAAELRMGVLARLGNGGRGHGRAAARRRGRSRIHHELERRRFYGERPYPRDICARSFFRTIKVSLLLLDDRDALRCRYKCWRAGCAPSKRASSSRLPIPASACGSCGRSSGGEAASQFIRLRNTKAA